MILFQVRDLAAKSCGEPHVAPSWDVAKASLGAMLAKTPDLADRAHSIRIDLISDWDPEIGLLDLKQTRLLCERGDVCLEKFRAACRKEEDFKQEEADRPLECLRDSVQNVLKEQAQGEVGQCLRESLSEFEKEYGHE